MSVIKHYSEVAHIPLNASGAKNTKKRLLIGSDDGVPLFSIRMFEIEKDGYTPHHSHDFEHEIYVIRGTGNIINDDGEHGVRAGSVIYVPAMEKHQIVNTGTDLLRVLCMVPKENE